MLAGAVALVSLESVVRIFPRVFGHYAIPFDFGNDGRCHDFRMNRISPDNVFWYDRKLRKSESISPINPAYIRHMPLTDPGNQFSKCNIHRFARRHANVEMIDLG
ncbi:MAG TPA: hypothetical protein PK765_07120 [bacterium]|nr:hypothetical protein [bacterium]